MSVLTALMYRESQDELELQQGTTIRPRNATLPGTDGAVGGAGRLLQ